jgi:hypothetical protein
MDEAKRTVDHTPQDFLAVWWRGEAGPVRRLLGLLLLCRHPCRQKARSEPPSLPADETEGERGCTIYEQRPSACRNFDCRAFSAMGLVEHCDRNHRTPDWSLRPRASPALATGCRALRRLPFTRRPLPDPSRAE